VHSAFTEAAQEKWLRYLLQPDDYALYTDLVKSIGLVDLKEVARVDIGVVTGNNAYFLLTAEEVHRWQIEPRFQVKAIHRAQDLPGAVLTVEDWRELRRRNRKCYLLKTNAPPDELCRYHAGAYITHGVQQRVPCAFKCRTREPWYAVPSVYLSDAFLTYMSNKLPRLVLNEAKAVSTNTIHRVTFVWKDDLRSKAFIASFYNTLTMLSAELVGRSYGGGVLKLEPSEAERIKVFRPPDELAEDLALLLPKVDQLLRAKAFDEVLQTVDRAILRRRLKVDANTLDRLSQSYRSLRQKRLMRATP